MALDMKLETDGDEILERAVIRMWLISSRFGPVLRTTISARLKRYSPVNISRRQSVEVSFQGRIKLLAHFNIFEFLIAKGISLNFFAEGIAK